MPDYKLLKDAYYGEGGFRDGSYVVKFDRETKQNHKSRKEMSCYTNYFSSIVNALVDPIFKKVPSRNYDGVGHEYIDAFLKNVDNNGMDIQNFMKTAAIRSRLLGAVFICVDNVTEMPTNMEETIEKRAFPYAYIVEPEYVTDWKMDNFGKLVSLTYEERVQVGERRTATRKTTFTEERITTTINGKVLADNMHNLGRIPVVYFPAAVFGGRQTVKPPSDMEPLARTAKTIFNYQSFLEEILRKQTFSILTMPMTSGDKTEIDIGTSNAIAYDPVATNGARPDFIAPPSDPARVLMDVIQVLSQQMYKMAGLSFINGAAPNASGVARQWEFERTNQALAGFADRCRLAEQSMVEIFEAWMNIDVGYTASYAKDFGIVDIATELANAQTIIDMDLTPSMKIEALKKVLAVFDPDMDSERYDELIAEAEKYLHDILQANAPELLPDALKG